MNGYLLDTLTFLRVTGGLPIGRATRKAYTDSSAVLYLSIASLWEIAIKLSLKKLVLTDPLDQILRRETDSNGLNLLPISSAHAIGVARLPFHHRDPFDRLLISQAMSENLVLLSSDRAFRLYKKLSVAW